MKHIIEKLADKRDKYLELQEYCHGLGLGYDSLVIGEKIDVIKSLIAFLQGDQNALDRI